MRIAALVAFGFLFAAGQSSSAAPPSPTTAEARARVAGAAARAWTTAHEADVVRQLVEFVAIPNVASDHDNIERNAQALVAMFAARGIDAKLLRVDGAPPLVVAMWRAPQARETVAFYAHYDGQPVDAKQWSTPPWHPVVRDGRVYGRSASDDKGAIVAMFAAIDALHSAHIEPRVNIEFVFEGEEEAGSPHLGAYLERYADQTTPDLWMICDGPVHQSGRMQLFFGARGVTDVEITTYGPNRPLHSGHYGNWAPNPIVALTHLIDSMRDTEGKILIPGFYDDVVPLSNAERAAIAETPPVDDSLRRELALGRSEGEGPLAERILAPALNLRGIESGHVGAAAANAIPSEAHASIDFRLVPRQSPERVREKVESFLSANGWFIVHDPPDAATRIAHSKVVRLEWGNGYPAARTPLDSPIAERIRAVLTAGLGEAPLRTPSLGGSVPMDLFMRGGRIPAVGLPIANYDNNQHAANENIKLENLWNGVRAFASLFAGM